MGYPPEWIEGLENRLARSSRPGHPSRDVAPKLVEEWVDDVKRMGIHSILCLLDREQLDFYRRLPGGLLEYYRQHGFPVAHVPIKDPAHHKSGWGELEKNLPVVYQKFCELPEPVLIHCSAGCNRTGEAVRYIQDQLLGANS